MKEECTCPVPNSSFFPVLPEAIKQKEHAIRTNADEEIALEPAVAKVGSTMRPIDLQREPSKPQANAEPESAAYGGCVRILGEVNSAYVSEGG